MPKKQHHKIQSQIISISLSLLLTLLFLFAPIQLAIYSTPISGHLIPSPPITTSKPYSQCLKITSTPTPISSLTLIFGTYTRVNQGNLTLSLSTSTSPSSPFFSSQSFPQSTLPDNLPLTINFPQTPPLTNLCFTLSSDNQNSATSASLWLSSNSTTPNAPIRITTTTALFNLILHPSLLSSTPLTPLFPFFSLISFTLILTLIYASIRRPLP